MAEWILMASSLSDFQLSLFSDLSSETGLLEKLALGLRTAMREGRSLDARLRKLLPSISRSGELSLSERGRLAVGGGAKGELPALLDKKPALNRLLFFWMLKVGSDASGTGEVAPDGLETRGMFRGIGEAPRGKDGSSELASSADSAAFWGVFWNSVKGPSSSSSFQRTDRLVALVCVFLGVKLTLFRPAATLRRRGEPFMGEAAVTGAS